MTSHWFRNLHRADTRTLIVRVILLSTFFLSVASMFVTTLTPFHLAAAGWCAALVATLLLHAVEKKSDAPETQKIALRASRTRKTLIIFGVIFIVAAILRIVALPRGVLYVDSLYHLLAAQNILHIGTPLYTRAFLYSVLVAATEGIVGFHTTAVMCMNVAINLTTLVVLFLVTRKLFSDTVALCASAIFAFAPWSIIMSSFIRMYDLLQLIVLIAVYMVYQFLSYHTVHRVGQTKVAFLRRVCASAVATVVVIGIAFHVHVLSLSVWIPCIIMVVVLALIHVVRAVAHHAWSNILRNRFVILSLVGLLGIVVLWLLGPKGIWQYTAGANSLFDIQQLKASGKDYLPFLLQQFPAALLGFFVGIATAVGITKVRRSPQMLFFVVVFFVAGIEILLFNRYFSPRYAYHLFPILIIVVSIGVVSFAQIIAESVLSKSKTKQHQHARIAVACIVIMLCALMPYKGLHTLYTAPKIGDNQIFEAAYPYQAAVKTVTIQPDDYLFQYNYGIWDTLQQTSTHIMTVNVDDLNGFRRSREETVRAFFNELTHAEHGWFMTDIYRLDRRDCSSLDELPCVVRAFIHDAFTIDPAHTVATVAVYEWNAHAATPVEDETQEAPSLIGGNTFNETVRLDPLQVEAGTKKNTIAVTHRFHSSEGNISGAFVVLHPTAHRNDGATVSLQKQVLFVPAYSPSVDAFTVTTQYHPTDNATLRMQDVDTITADVTLLDLATDTLHTEPESRTLYAR